MKKMVSRFFSAEKSLWLLTVAVIAAALVPAMVQQGMFFDGITYSTIAHNLASGYGSFWEPHYTQTLYANFHEHPPLVFGIQALFFKLLGGGFFVEKIYAFLTAILTVVGIGLCWSLFSKESAHSRYAWLPVLLWISVPLTTWSYQNNMLENTMGMFTIFSVYVLSKAMVTRRWLWLIPGAILIVAAILSKGPVGLFPLAVPLIYGVVFKVRSFGKPLFHSLLTTLLVGGLFFIIMHLIPGARESLTAYLDQQLMPALNNEREVTANNRFVILFQLLLELTLPIVLLIGIFSRQLIKQKLIQIPYKREALYFLLIALAASIPLIITLKQRKFYLLPSIPFFVLGIGHLIIPYVQAFVSGLSRKVYSWISGISMLVFISVIAFSIKHTGDYARDKQLIMDVEHIAAEIPSRSIIGTSEALCHDWSLVAYLARYGQISLACSGEKQHFLNIKGEPLPSGLNGDYRKVNIGLGKYQLWEKN